ncbi:unnamed protein product [Calypogeia fissa]
MEAPSTVLQQQNLRHRRAGWGHTVDRRRHTLQWRSGRPQTCTVPQVSKPAVSAVSTGVPPGPRRGVVYGNVVCSPTVTARAVVESSVECSHDRDPSTDVTVPLSTVQLVAE